MEVTVYTSSLFRSVIGDDSSRSIALKFKKYKESGMVPEDFGRDVPYEYPASVKSSELYHLHLQGKEKFRLNAVQFKRTSDTHLIYCRGSISPNNYLLVTLLKGNAHAQARRTTFLLAMAEIADSFRARF